MSELKLSPLPKHEMSRMSVTLPKSLADALNLYVADFNALYHEEADLASLIPHMLESFLRSDKTFMKRHAASIREQAARTASPLPSGPTSGTP